MHADAAARPTGDSPLAFVFSPVWMFLPGLVAGCAGRYTGLGEGYDGFHRLIWSLRGAVSSAGGGANDEFRE